MSQMSYTPETLQYMTYNIDEVSRNKFRLETVSADTAQAGRIVTFNLPENCILDCKSLAFFADIECFGATVGAATVHAKMPPHISSMISRLEVFCNGIALNQGCSEYNTVCQALRLGQSNLDKENSIDRALSHSFVTNNAASDNETICMREWRGILGECSTRYLNLSALGQIQIRLTWAGNNVLVPKEGANNVGTDLTADGLTAAQSMRYEVSSMYFTCDTITLSPLYNASIRARLENGGMAVNFKEYYTFQLDGINGTGASARFSLSSGCINSVLSLYRDMSYSSVGVKGHEYTNTALAPSYSSNYLRFRSYSGDTKLVGANSGRYQYSINNVKYPQYLSTFMDLLNEVSYSNDKVSQSTEGNLITSREAYNDGKFLAPVLLSLPTGHGCKVTAGYNSRGINTQMVFQGQALTIPVAGQADTQQISCFTIVDSTATLMIKLGRNLAVQY